MSDLLYENRRHGYGPKEPPSLSQLLQTLCDSRVFDIMHVTCMFSNFFQKPAKIVEEGYDMFACSVQTSYLTTAASLATYSSFTSEDLSTSRTKGTPACHLQCETILQASASLFLLSSVLTFFHWHVWSRGTALEIPLELALWQQHSASCPCKPFHITCSGFGFRFAGLLFSFWLFWWGPVCI